VDLNNKGIELRGDEFCVLSDFSTATEQNFCLLSVKREGAHENCILFRKTHVNNS